MLRINLLSGIAHLRLKRLAGVRCRDGVDVAKNGSPEAIPGGGARPDAPVGTDDQGEIAAAARPVRVPAHESPPSHPITGVSEGPSPASFDSALAGMVASTSSRFTS